METLNIMDILANGKNCEKSKGIGLLEFDANQQLPADELTLRQYGLKDNKGEFTPIALELVMQKLVREHEAYLLELIGKKEGKEEDKKAE